MSVVAGATQAQIAVKKLEQIAGFLNPSTKTNLGLILQQLHSHFLTTGILSSSLHVLTKLIFSYAAATSRPLPDLLRGFFKSLQSASPLPFNVLISDFSNRGFPTLALSTLCFMHRNGVTIDTYALCSALTTSLGDCSDVVGQLHTLAMTSGSCRNVYVSSALIHSYARRSRMDDAQKIFDENPDRNTVCANALLLGYVDSGMWFDGLKLARKLLESNLSFDHRTLLATLRACTGASAIEFGRQVHGYIVRKIGPPEIDMFLQSSLIEMYGQCGLSGKARAVFDAAENSVCIDLVLWTSMLGVYGRSGRYLEVIELYEKMVATGIKPDEVSFVTVISACARTNQVELGICYFKSMMFDYELDPWQEHYSCLVDLLSRAGRLDEALDFICDSIQKGCRGSASMWGALLNSCFDRGHIELGKLAAQRALELDPGNIGVYTMLSNLYARMGMWDEIGSLRKSIHGRGLKKDKGCSWIEIAS